MKDGNTGKLYAFWKYDRAPFLLGDEVSKVYEDGSVSVVKYSYRFKPVLIVPLEKGIKLQKKLNKANAKYNKVVGEAYQELREVVKSIMG